MLERIVKKGVRYLDMAIIAKDLLKQTYGELLTETQTSIGVAKKKNGYCVSLRVTKKDVDLSIIDEEVLTVPVEIIYAEKMEKRGYIKPNMESEIVDMKTKDGKEKIYPFVHSGVLAYMERIRKGN